MFLSHLILTCYLRLRSICTIKLIKLTIPFSTSTRITLGLSIQLEMIQSTVLLVAISRLKAAWGEKKGHEWLQKLSSKLEKHGKSQAHLNCSAITSKQPTHPRMDLLQLNFLKAIKLQLKRKRLSMQSSWCFEATVWTWIALLWTQGGRRVRIE